MRLRGRRHTPGVLLAVDEERPLPSVSAATAQPVTLDEVGAVIVGLLDPGAHRAPPAGTAATSG
jgi:hypothetical protein